MLSGTEGPLSLVGEMGALKLREQPVKARFMAVPKVNYVGTKGKIESVEARGQPCKCRTFYAAIDELRSSTEFAGRTASHRHELTLGLTEVGGKPGRPSKL
jgi:hypothetical protein